MVVRSISIHRNFFVATMPIEHNEPGLARFEHRTTNRLNLLPGMCLLFLMLSLPAGFQNVKLILLLIVAFQILLITIRTNNIFLHPVIFGGLLLYAIVGLSYTLFGFARGNAGSIPMLKEFVGYLAIFTVLISGIRHFAYISYIDRILLLSTLFICVYSVLTMLVEFGLYPRNLYVDFYSGSGMQAVSLNNGSFAMDLPSLPSLLFLQPYLASRIILDKPGVSLGYVLVFCLATIVMLCAGRRALALVAVVTPLIIVLVIFARRVGATLAIWRLVKVLVLAAVAAAMAIVFLQKIGFNIFAYIAEFADGFTRSAAGGGAVRYEQYEELISGWFERPWFGYGLGAVHRELVRSVEQPWNYELSYLKLLYDLGIVGLSIYVAGFTALSYVSIRISRLNRKFAVFLLPMLVGTLAFLIGNATNPYLLKFDYLIVLFLPLALVNLWYARFSRSVWKMDVRR